MRRYRITTALLIALLLLPASVVAEEYDRVIRTNHAEYSVAVKGTRAPVNEAVIIENLGHKDIVNPRIKINGRYDWFDLESITAEAIRGCDTDEEKAMAIWCFVSDNSHYGGCAADGSLLNTVRFLNITGSNNCAYWACAVVSLAETAGLKARVWEIGHHTVPEVYFNDAWHLIDSRMGGNFGLLRDNKTIASAAYLESDPFYLDRALIRIPLMGTTVPDPHLVAMLYVTARENYIEKGYESRRLTPRTMALTLRPGEKLIRHFSQGEKWYGWGGEKARRPAWYGREVDSYTKPQAYTSGQLVWKPDFQNFPLDQLASSVENAASAADDGRSPGLHVDVPRSDHYSMPSRVTFPVQSPWPVIGGNITCTAYAYGKSNLDEASVSFEVQPGRGRVWSMSAEGQKSFEAPLDQALNYGRGGVYNYDLRFWLSCPPDSIPFETDYQPPSHDRPVQAGVEGFTLTTDFQLAPKSVPALSLGENNVLYTDETPGVHQVKITHVWTELRDNHPPPASPRAVMPAFGHRSRNLTPLLMWEPSRDRDRADTIAEYHIFISLHPECIWPLSSNFDVPTDLDRPSFQVPAGWLNRDTTYYWKVRARDSRDVWGAWSRIFKFSTP